LRQHLLVLAILALPASQPGRTSATFDLPGYLREIDRVREAIAASATPEEARAVAAALPDRWWVTSDALVIVIDTSWVDDDISASVTGTSPWPSVREKIERRLSTMRAAAAEPPGHGGPDPEQALEAVLARPEFHRGATSRWLDEQRSRVGNWILRMLNRLTGSGPGGRAVAIVFAWTLSIVALVALTLWFVTMLTRRSRAAALELGAAAPPRAPAREWTARALAAARAGDIREAVHCGYNAAVCKLDEQGIWSVDESRTPREYLAILRSDDPRHSVLADLTRQFEQIWYGGRAATADDAQKLSAHLERLGCLRESERAI
jgi:hypothetical protein